MPILQQNAIPVFADVDPLTLNMTPASVEAKITDRTRAIILVHLFGRPCEVDAVAEVAKRHGLVLIEDCSQCHATKYRDRYVGTFGQIGCFSLQQSKHMTTGDGGMVITDCEETFRRLRLFADKGWDYRYMGERDHAFLAPTYRTTELMGAVGLAQLQKVRSVVERRASLGELLCRLIADAPGVRAVPAEEDREVSWWNFIFHVTGHDPDAFCRAVSAEGVAVSPHYIGKPIFACGEFLTARRTYGTSGCPFTCRAVSRDHRYTSEQVPGAVKGLETVAVRGIHEHMAEGDIRDMGRAIQKVARALSSGS